MHFEIDLEHLDQKTTCKNKVYQIPNCQLEEFEKGIDYDRLCLEALYSQLPLRHKARFKKRVEQQTGIKLFPQFYCIES